MIRGVIVIPAYNEQESIANCLSAITIALNELDHPQNIDVVVVDNNSTDNTGKIAKSFCKNISTLSVIEENEIGIGYARATGVRYALSNKLRKHINNDKYWIINTDADGVVPKSWLVDWTELFKKNDSLIYTGSSKFDVSFNKRYPVSSKLFFDIGKKISIMEKLFGVFNIDGFNSAVESSCYGVAGQFQQPKGVPKHGQHYNLPGEDWDLSTRARLLGFVPLRSSKASVVVSSRRFEISPLDYFCGEAYEKPFEKVDDIDSKPDIKLSNSKEVYKKAVLRLCMHFVEKPLLIDNNLISKSNIYQKFGNNLTKEIKNWINITPKPSMFYHREKFILDYLVSFHSKFGVSICNNLFENKYD